MHFVEKKNIILNKNETESKMENPAHSFREINLVSSYKNHKLKYKTVMSWSSQIKKKPFFVQFILFEGLFLTFVFYLNV